MKVSKREMPALPPTLRIRLKTPLALPISLCGRVPMATAERGTKTIASPTPVTMEGQAICHMAISRLSPPMSHSETATRKKPQAISLRKSTTPVR